MRLLCAPFSLLDCFPGFDPVCLWPAPFGTARPKRLLARRQFCLLLSKNLRSVGRCGVPARRTDILLWLYRLDCCRGSLGLNKRSCWIICASGCPFGSFHAGSVPRLCLLLSSHYAEQHLSLCALSGSFVMHLSAMWVENLFNKAASTIQCTVLHLGSNLNSDNCCHGNLWDPFGFNVRMLWPMPSLRICSLENKKYIFKKGWL